MSCLSLAAKLAAKGSDASTASVSAVPQKKVHTRPATKPENVQAGQGNTEGQREPSYVPPIEAVLTDENLGRYIRRFLAERHQECIFEFIDAALRYKSDFGGSTSHKKKMHLAVIQKLGNLPTAYLEMAREASEEMTDISANSFDGCVAKVIDELGKHEYKAFIHSPLFSKWVLKYHNTVCDE